MERQSKWLLIAAIAAIMMWSAWALQIQIAHWFGRSWHIGNAGSWGDTFGALNAAFAAAASLGVLWTLGLQRQQLELQRIDIDRQQKQIMEAEISQQKQRFESSFYELLQLLRTERSDLRFRYSPDFSNEHSIGSLNRREVFEGKMAVRAAVREIMYWLNSEPGDEPLTKHQVFSVYKKRVHVRYESSLGPYFRIIYTILRRISEEKSLCAEEKIEYGNLLRSQLTSHEAMLVAINGLAEFSGNLQAYVIEFRLLKYIRRSNLKIFEATYPPEASEGR